MGGNTGSSGLSNLFGGGSQSFDPTTGAPLGSIGDPTGGVFWANPSNPGVTENAPQQAAQNIQESSYDPTTGQPTTTSPTGSQSGPSTPSWVQNLSNMFLGSQSSPAAQAGLTGGRGGATPEIGPGWPTQAPGAAGAAVPGSSGGVNPYSQTGLPTASATVSPQSAPVSGKTQAVPEVAPATPAPEAAPAPAAATADTTNYPDVSGTSRESGMGPTGPTTIDTGVSASGTGIPPVLQDLFSLNFGRFIADLLGQQGLPAGQNQAAAPRPPANTGTTTDTASYDPTTGEKIAPADDTGTKTAAGADQKAQSPLAKAAGAVGAVGEAVKPKPSPVGSGPGPGAAPSAPAGAAGTATAAPTTPAEAVPGAPATGQPSTAAAAPATAPGPAGTNLMGTGFFDPRGPGSPAGVPPPHTVSAPGMVAPGTPGTAPGTGGPTAAPGPEVGPAAVPRGGGAEANLPSPTTGGLPPGRAADDGRAIEPPARPGTAPAQNWWGTRPPDYFQRHGEQPGQNLTTINTPFGRVTANRQVANDLQGLTQDWQQAGVPGISKLGGYNDRGKRYGAGKSSHSYGAAFDINDQAGRMNPQLQNWINQHPQQWQQMLRNHNFAQYMPQGDPNHIEWVGPEAGTQVASRASVGLAGPAGAVSAGRATRGDINRNPGNIKMGQDARQYGATGTDRQGHAIFPTVEAGIRAQASLLQRNYNNKTVSEMGRSYAKDPGWAAGVMQAGGFGPNERLNLNDPATLRRLQEAIWRQEGTHPEGTRPNVGNAVGIPSRQGIDPRYGRAGVVSG